MCFKSSKTPAAAADEGKVAEAEFHFPAEELASALQEVTTPTTRSRSLGVKTFNFEQPDADSMEDEDESESAPFLPRELTAIVISYLKWEVGDMCDCQDTCGKFYVSKVVEICDYGAVAHAERLRILRQIEDVLSSGQGHDTVNSETGTSSNDVFDMTRCKCKLHRPVQRPSVKLFVEDQKSERDESGSSFTPRSLLARAISTATSLLSPSSAARGLLTPHSVGGDVPSSFHFQTPMSILPPSVQMPTPTSTSRTIQPPVSIYHQQRKTRELERLHMLLQEPAQPMSVKIHCQFPRVVSNSHASMQMKDGIQLGMNGLMVPVQG